MEAAAPRDDQPAPDVEHQQVQLQDAANPQEEEPVGDNRFRSEEDLGRMLSQDDPDRMKLTREEHERAVEMKELVEGMPDLDDLSDLMYAQWAIVCTDGDLSGALDRAYALQEFRLEYKILDTYEHGKRYLKNHFELFPQQMLSFSFSEKDGTYVFVHDFNKFDPQKFTCAEMAEDWLRGMYYSHTLFHPDLESIRRGIICVVECEGMNLRRDVMKHYQDFFSQFLTHYPFIGQCRHYHTGSMVNVMSSVLRRILPKELMDQYQVGLRFEGHMGDAFLVPTVEQANRRMRTRMEEALKLRYHNEKTFSLGE